MCGISGIAALSARTRISEPDVRRMLPALRHRGPDGDAVVITNGASLGHARLAILDPRPEGDQPMWNDAKTTVIVYNGEIFNYRELRDRYRLDCRTGTDTEVLLKLFDRFGMGFVPELRGMFAFGIFDIQKNEWHLARDTGGIKPLFVAYPKGKLHFASEMRALMSALPSKPALNMQSLSLYLRLQYIPGPQTMCDGIESLPPGTILHWCDGREERTRFEVHVDQTPSYSSRNAFSTDFPSLMDRVVADHLISDKPVGIFLSGGMDSSIVLHHMNNHASKPIKTFTVRFDATKDEDEARFNRDAVLAAQTAKHYGTDHHEITLTANLCRQIYADCACALDQPNADSVAMAQFVLAHEAKKHVDVVLCGAGGDELFGGYPRYRVARILLMLRPIPASMRGVAAKKLGYPSDVLAMQPGSALAERLLARPAAEIMEYTRGDWFDPSATTELFHERFRTLHLENDPIREFMEFDRHTWLVDESLRLADAMTMASGLECRVPFLDPLIIAASHATPAKWHVSLKRTKCLLKDTYQPLLPPHLFALGKSSFYPPLAKWLRRECKPLIDEALAGKRIGELFNTDVLQRIADEHIERKRYGLHTVSTIIQLHEWFERVYDT